MRLGPLRFTQLSLRRVGLLVFWSIDLGFLFTSFLVRSSTWAKYAEGFSGQLPFGWTEGVPGFCNLSFLYFSFAQSLYTSYRVCPSDTAELCWPEGFRSVSSFFFPKTRLWRHTRSVLAQSQVRNLGDTPVVCWHKITLRKIYTQATESQATLP